MSWKTGLVLVILLAAVVFGVIAAAQSNPQFMQWWYGNDAGSK
jgi:hypothetical protein